MYIDSHVHLDNIYRAAPERIQWLREQECIPVSWSFAEKIEQKNDLEHYLAQKADFIRQMNDGGLQCYFLAGIHPRNIPPDLKPEHVREILLPFLENPFCLGIGEIGLETTKSQEREIFEAQLALADVVRDMDKRFGVHTPRKNKRKVTAEILDILTGCTEIEDITVVDHCTPDTVAKVLKAGFRAGITVSPAKTSLEELFIIVEQQEQKLKRIMCNTDSGTIFHEDLYWISASENLPPEICDELVYGTAARFFGISGEAKDDE